MASSFIHPFQVKCLTPFKQSLSRRRCRLTTRPVIASYTRGKATSSTRVFLSGPFHPGAEYTLPPEEAAHLRARRIRHGSQITLFDGTGAFATATLDSESSVTVLTTTSAEARSKSICAIIALPKSPSRADGIVEKLVELGVHRLVWARTERVIAAAPNQARLARWARLAVAASKQSMRTDVPIVQTTSNWGELLELASQSDLVLLLSAAGTPILGQRCTDAVRAARNIAVLVGPEGGFTDTEEEKLEAVGALKIGLGSNRLRVETAAFTAVAVLMQVALLESSERTASIARAKGGTNNSASIADASPE
ncbi:unnamed protein product [Chondrus crispus]|uniref:16S rRNA (uracil(1498)-N(3))-methyltransferase n=1 Tax=Chondrus crispus TaxID=2769 RepID=R7QLU6_CHOCR|nr:unnamed protein product [Chondrus crispus]CDF38446.1 unnamed protein product [Chondrus crispus]|eukprot:XP_005718339.1 unnamed protein product [Chondrus crispus]